MWKEAFSIVERVILHSALIAGILFSNVESVILHYALMCLHKKEKVRRSW